jgi:hypothetical protein
VVGLPASAGDLLLAVPSSFHLFLASTLDSTIAAITASFTTVFFTSSSVVIASSFTDAIKDSFQVVDRPSCSCHPVIA